MKCWGDNEHGDLGDGTSVKRSSPVDVSGLTSGVAAVSAGYNHTCALTTLGGVKCWGDNNSGELGDGTITNRSAPVDVSGLTSGVVLISAGNNHTCAVTTAGGVKCWGAISDINYGSVPADVPDLTSGVAAVSAGGGHACAVSTAGGLRCWGYNGNGELGDAQACGTATCSTPVDVVGLTNGVASVSAGYYYTCAVTTAGGAKCWGNNYYFTLGDGSNTTRTTPVDVYGLTSSVAAISAASTGGHTCAVTVASAAYCWGRNASGQLGIGNTQSDSAPNPNGVYGLASGVASVAAGGFGHTCAVTTTGGLKCWGANDSGQLGDGTYITRTVPGNVTAFGPGPKSTPGKIAIANLGQYALPKTCFQVENGLDFTPLFTVCDNDFQPPVQSNSVCQGDGVCEDENPANGAVVVTVIPGNYVIAESTAPPQHSPPVAAQPCNASEGPCALTFVNTPNTRPWHPWDITGAPGGGPDGYVRIQDILAVIQHYFDDKPLPTPTP